MGHQGNQRGLAHVGGLARHVGAGDDQHPLLPVHPGVVGHKAAPRQHPLHHRVAAPFYPQAAFLVDPGPDIAVFQRRLGQRLQGVQGFKSQGQVLQPGQGLSQPVQHLLIEGGLQPGDLIRRAQGLFLQVVELLGGVALRVGQGLAPGVALRHQGIVGLRHLNIVAKDPVVLHLQVFDAGGGPLPGLQVADPLPAVPGGAPGLVQFRAVPRPDHPAIRQQHRGLRVNGPGEQRRDVRQRGEQVMHLPDPLLGQGGQQRLGLGRGLQAPEQRQAVPGAQAPVAQLAQQPLNIIHLFKQKAGFLQQQQVLPQSLDTVQPGVNAGLVHQRGLHPGFKQAPAHGGAGFVQHMQQVSVVLAPQRA